jgi:iron complex outermembrane receptor protein
LNTSFYFYKWNDMIATALAPQGAGTILQNAASSEIRGAEIDQFFRATQELRLRLAVSYVDSKFTDFPNAAVEVPTGLGTNAFEISDVSGNELPRSPKLSGSLQLDYQKYLSAGTFETTVTTYYESKWYADDGNYLEAPASTILNATISWSPANTRFTVSVWGSNLTNEVYETGNAAAAAAFIASFGPPRTFGVNGTYHF